MRLSFPATFFVLAISSPLFAQGTADDFERARRWPEKNALAKLVRLDYQWVDQDTLFYTRNVGEKIEHIAVDTTTGKKSPAFDHEALARQLKEQGHEADATKLLLTSVRWMHSDRIAFVAFGKSWEFDRKDSYLESAGAPQPGRSLTLSPDGKMRIRNVDENLVLFRDGESQPIPLTQDGGPHRQYNQFYWSPDSKVIAAFQVTPAERKKVYRIRSVPDEGVRPELVEQNYELPGDELDTHQLILIDAETAKITKVNDDPFNLFAPSGVWWTSDGKKLRLSRLMRGYQNEKVVEVDARTGVARTIIDEKTSMFLMPSYWYLHHLGDDQIIWASERDGYRHLYLYDAQSGQVKRQLTKGAWVVRDVGYVGKDFLIFSANGREPNRDPYLLHWYRLELKDGAEPVLLTPEPSHHAVTISPDGNWIADSYSRVDQAPIHVLRSAKTGEIVAELEKAEIEAWQKSGGKMPEPFVAKGRDGQTDIYGLIYRPSNFDPAKKYPVVENIYNGPHDAHVRKSWAASDRNQMLAELGFIVVQIDAMGTAHRGMKFHSVSYKNLGDGGFPDRIPWIKAAAQKYAQFDLSKGVGIYGYSAGGYDSAHALLTHNDFYTVAVSLCGNHDHRTDKTWWNELWMGYPVGPHYEEQSNATLAANLIGKLLLIAGEQDDNVNPHAGTMRFVDALVKADKDFDMLYLPGRTHNLGGWYVDRKIFSYFVEHLLNARN